MEWIIVTSGQEPTYYLNNPPIETAIIRLPLYNTFFSLGFTPWAMYSLFGLIVAYNFI
jgi:glycine betaine transporter